MKVSYMKAAPIGAFGAMAFTIGRFGTGAILNLMGLIATFYVTAALFVFVVLGVIARMAATAGVAVTRTAAVTVGGAVLALFLGLAVGAFIGLDQGLTVGDRDLVIVGMYFAEGEEAVAVAAIFDKRRLQ